jgi:hypothetical protein
VGDRGDAQGAPQVRAQRIATTNLEECDARLNASAAIVRHDQMAKGSFAADITQIIAPHVVRMALVSYGAPVTSIGAP